MAEIKPVLVVMQLTDNPRRIEGSSVCRCGRCKARCLIAPSGRRLVLTHKAEVVCNRCALDAFQRGEVRHILPIGSAPGQADEIRRWREKQG